MKPLTENEIVFVKGTNYTATVWQCNEWSRTVWGHEPTYAEIATWCMHAGIAEVYDVLSAGAFLDCLHEKFNNVEDSISVENLGIYLFRTFLTREEMEDLLHQPPVEVCDDGYRFTASAKFLKDWKYFNGFRKIDDADYILEMALDPRWTYSVDDDGDVWYDLMEDES